MLIGEMEYEGCPELAKAIYYKMVTMYTIDRLVESGKFDAEIGRLETIRRIEKDNIQELSEVFKQCMYE